MMAAILNSTMLDSDTAILDSDTFLSSLRFTQKTLTSLWLWLKLIQSDWQAYSFSLNLLMAAILNLAILDSATLVFPLKLTHTCQDWFPPIAQKRLHSHFPPYHLHKKNFTHSFWLNLMMAAILNSAMLDSDTLFSSLRFTQKHFHSTLTLDSN